MSRCGPETGGDEAAGVVGIGAEESLLPIGHDFDEKPGDPDSPAEIIANPERQRIPLQIEEERGKQSDEDPNALNRPPNQEFRWIVSDRFEADVLAGAENAEEEKGSETQSPRADHAGSRQLPRGGGEDGGSTTAAQSETGVRQEEEGGGTREIVEAFGGEYRAESTDDPLYSEVDSGQS